MAKHCLNHANSPAVAMCTQCHRPICQSCTMVTPSGKYCSSECSILHKEFTTKLRHPGARKSGAGMIVLFFVLLIVAGFFGVHFAVRRQDPGHWLKKYDVIGRFLSQGQK